MSLRTHGLCLAFLAASSAAAQQPDARPRIIIDQSGTVHPWNHLDLNNKPETFQFAIVTDRTGGHRDGIFETGVDKLNLLQPEFVMSVGDLIEGYTEDETQIDREWAEFTGFIGKLQMPFFYVPGNHDYINPVMARKWKERFGRDYYHFVYKDVLFLAVNSEERMQGAGRGYIDDPQYDYFKEVLAQHPEVKWTLLFMHQPLWNQENTGRWKDLEQLLASRRHTVFVGHNHRYVKYERNNGKYFILATTGGGSRLRGRQFGEFDHVVWVTMTDNGPIIANLMLDGIWDENVNTEAYFAFAQPLMSGRSVQVEPLLMEKGAFKRGELTVRLTNDSDVPMQAALALESNAWLWAPQPDRSLTVQPNSVEIVKLPVQAGSQPAGSGIEPVQLRITTIYQPEDQPQLELNTSVLVRPEWTRTILPAAKPVQVDGSLGEWKALRFSSEGAKIDADAFSHQGDADGSFRFDVSYDDGFVYIGVEVADDQVELNDLDSPLNQDGLGFMADARPTRVSASAHEDEVFRNWIFVGLRPGTAADAPGVIYPAQYLPPGVQYACKRSPGGYTAELALPAAWLEAQYGGPWQSLRLNVMLNDRDLNGMHRTSVYWQPDWREADNILGSGTFRKP